MKTIALLWKGLRLKSITWSDLLLRPRSALRICRVRDVNRFGVWRSPRDAEYLRLTWLALSRAPAGSCFVASSEDESIAFAQLCLDGQLVLTELGFMRRSDWEEEERTWGRKGQPIR